ncbi:Hypothetical protein NTJ_07573 [Nesidiocoris tenuis]|uniref:Uncharacterized protein n=1 Tax=Nesidiocoris tenuis TaxID=355587 RepID=A0ABN7ARC9_9HEMI|nr:Hypothetical protein NTJ_07573 [Nesidiocoris tenuis]
MNQTVGRPGCGVGSSLRSPEGNGEYILATSEKTTTTIFRRERVRQRRPSLGTCARYTTQSRTHRQGINKSTTNTQRRRVIVLGCSRQFGLRPELYADPARGVLIPTNKERATSRG